MKRVWIITCVLSLAVLAAGCMVVNIPPVDDTTTTEKPEQTTTTTTIALAVTDAQGNVVTTDGGLIVTTQVSALPTEVQTVTNADSSTTGTQHVITSHIVVGTDAQGQQTTSVVSEQTVTTTAGSLIPTQDNVQLTSDTTTSTTTTTTTATTASSGTSTTSSTTTSQSATQSSGTQTSITIKTNKDGWGLWY
ncbi:MAG: hypothetical protein IJP14_00415 [Clostridia bacterium]|nr:hypothetical protein [Clostridia bacterium]